MKLLFVADPLESFKTYKDSTFAMMREAAARQHDLFTMQQEDVVWTSGVVAGHAQRLHLTGDPQAWYGTDATQVIALKDFDAVVMRKDPPFDMEYVYSTYLLELAQEQGARIFNNPRAIRDCNEKLTFAPRTAIFRTFALSSGSVSLSFFSSTIDSRAAISASSR